MFATIEEALSYGEGFRKRLNALLENPEFRPPWVSSISSLYASTEEHSIEYYYERGQKGMSPDERKLLDTAYAVRRAAIFGDNPPSDASMDRLMQLIDQGGYIVAPKIHDDVDKIRGKQGQDKPDIG